MNRFLTPKQVAELLQLAPNTIRSYCTSGVFPGAFQAKKNGAWRIPESDLEKHNAPAELVEVFPGVLLPPRSRQSQANIDAAERRRRRRELGSAG